MMDDDPFSDWGIGDPAENWGDILCMVLFFGGVFALLWFAEAVAAAQ